MQNAVDRVIIAIVQPHCNGIVPCLYRLFFDIFKINSGSVVKTFYVSIGILRKRIVDKVAITPHDVEEHRQNIVSQHIADDVILTLGRDRDTVSLPRVHAVEMRIRQHDFVGRIFQYLGIRSLNLTVVNHLIFPSDSYTHRQNIITFLDRLEIVIAVTRQINGDGIRLAFARGNISAVIGNYPIDVISADQTYRAELRILRFAVVYKLFLHPFDVKLLFVDRIRAFFACKAIIGIDCVFRKLRDYRMPSRGDIILVSAI